MSIFVKWDDETTKCILHYVYQGAWTWDEHYQVIKDGLALFETVPYIVDLIIDMSDGVKFPPGNVLSHFRNISSMYHARAGHTAILNNNSFLRSMFATFNQVYKPNRIKGKVIFAENIEEARRVLFALQKDRADAEDV